MIKGEQAYRYALASAFDPARGRLELATSGGRTATGPAMRPRFFSGFFAYPQVAAEAVRAVARVASSRYLDLPTPGVSRDPVVTCDGEGLRFEAFSACGGVYARADVLSAGLDGEVFERGTTNVDVGEPLRRLLAGVRAGGVLHVAVGSDDVVFTEPEQTVTERRVPLPTRWLRGFAESQQLASTFEPRFEVPATEAARFLRTVSGPRAAGWVLPAGRGVRLSGRASAQAAYLGGGRRLEAMLPLLRLAARMRAYGPTTTPELDSAPSAWELDLPGLHLTLLLSPAPNRGLSGEGAVLDALAGDEVTGDAEAVHAELNFQPGLDTDELASVTGLPAARVRAALTALAATGSVGYDLSAAAYFHRELPYDSDALEALNPRLRTARALVAAGAVRLDGPVLAEVRSGDRTYRVRTTATGEDTCTCTWWTNHRGGRGPCKHVLAVRIVRHRSAIDGEGIEDGDGIDVARDGGADRAR